MKIAFLKEGSYNFLSDGGILEACLLDGLARIIDGLGWEAKYKLVLSFNGSSLHHVVMNVADQVMKVKSDGGTLAIMESDLNRSLRL